MAIQTDFHHLKISGGPCSCDFHTIEMDGVPLKASRIEIVIEPDADIVVRVDYRGCIVDLDLLATVQEEQ